MVRLVVFLWSGICLNSHSCVFALKLLWHKDKGPSRNEAEGRRTAASWRSFWIGCWVFGIERRSSAVNYSTAASLTEFHSASFVQPGPWSFVAPPRRIHIKSQYSASSVLFGLSAFHCVQVNHGLHVLYVCMCFKKLICVCVCVCPPGSIPFGAVEAPDSGCEWLCRGWRAGAGSAGRSESGGGERRHGRVLPQVWYVWRFQPPPFCVGALAHWSCKHAEDAYINSLTWLSVYTIH